MRRLIPQALYHCRTNAAVVMVVCIVVVEFFLHPYLSQNFFSHEVDRTLYNLETSHQNQAVVAIGDSVGHGIFGGWKFESGRLANLACNQATETAGQYFFLKRFLKNNAVPSAVISCDRTPFSGNLNQNLTENYVQRCFTEWSEIMDLMMVKLDPVFTLKMVAYKFLATFKYRLHLQKNIIGFTNSDIYSGASGGGAAIESDYGLIRLISKFMDRLRQESISTHYFKKMLTDLDQLQVPLYYLPPPSRITNNQTHQLVQSSMRKMKELKEEFSNVHIVEDQYRRLPEKYFHDDVHLNQDGLKKYRPPVQPVLEQYITDSRQRQKDNFSQAFASGQPIFAIDSFSKSNRLLPLNDTIVDTADGELVIRAVGNDPSLLLPVISRGEKRSSDQVVIRIELESSDKTTAQLYFTHGPDAPFNEKNSVRQAVEAGPNSLFFTLPPEFREGKLRFDPGVCKGLFTLQQLEAKLVAAKLL